MKILIISGCCFAALLLILLFIILFVKFKISVRVNNKNVKVYVSKIKVYDSSDSASDTNVTTEKDDEFEEKYSKMKIVINFFRKVLDDKNDDIINILKYAKKTVTVKKLDVSLDYGFDDAALTGITGGIIWTVISGFSGFIGRFVDIKKFTNIAVKPYYTEKILEFKLEFVCNVRILHFIKTLRYIKRFKKTLEGRR